MLRVSIAGWTGLCAGWLTAAPVMAGLLDGRGWTWEEKVDPVSDEVRRTAFVFSTVHMVADNPAAFLSLHCVSKRPAIYLGWDAKVVTQKNWQLEYRFAGQPGHRLNARYVNRSAQIVADLGDIRRFVSEARLSDSLYVRVTSNAYGASEAVFATRGGEDMAARFVAACPGAAAR